MQAAGMRLLRHYSYYSVMGFSEVISKIFHLRREVIACRNNILAEKPDILVLVDFSGFNLRMARFAKEQGIKVVYYISPKFWAWNKSRLNKINKYVDRLCCIFPFEPQLARSSGYNKAIYVGNPTLNGIVSKTSVKSIPSNQIAIFPGSRLQEVRKLIPTLCELMSSLPNQSFVVSKADNLEMNLFVSLTNFSNVRLIEKDVQEIVCEFNPRLAIVASGTATLELAVLNVPQIVVYKTSFVTFFIAKMLAKVEFISLVNLLANRSIVPELIQSEFNIGNLRRAISDIANPQAQKKISEGYSEIINMLGDRNASEETAQIILDLGRS